MEGVAVLGILSALIVLSWFGYHFGYRLLDAFSAVRREYGIVVEKEYIPPHSQIVTKRVVRSDGNGEFGSTSYNIFEEVQVAEECILHVKLNERLIVTSVTDKLYDSVNQGDRVFVKYSQGRFSKKIYLKAVKRPKS